MGRTRGAKDKVAGGRVRRTATVAEQTRKADQRAAKEARERLAAQKAAAAARQSFFSRAGSRGAGSSNAADEAAEDVASGSTDAAADDGENEDVVGGSVNQDSEAARGNDEADDNGAQVSAAGERREARPADVEAELDDDDDVEQTQPDDVESDMHLYLTAVFDRLHSETIGEASRSAERKWLLEILQHDEADWWLRAGKAPHVCRMLGLTYGEPAYYRDIKVWLPDVQWGHEATPPCVECGSAARVVGRQQNRPTSHTVLRPTSATCAKLWEKRSYSETART